VGQWGLLVGGWGAIAGGQASIGADDVPGGVYEPSISVAALLLETAMGLVLGQAEAPNEDSLGALDGSPGMDGRLRTPELGLELIEVVGARGGNAKGGDERLGWDRLYEVDECTRVEGEFDRLAGSGWGEDDDSEAGFRGCASEDGSESEASRAGSHDNDGGSEFSDAVVRAAGGQNEGTDGVAGVV